MKNPKKIQIQFKGQTYVLPANSIGYETWGDNTGKPYIYMRAKNVASMIKQYVKKNHPEVKVWATSDVYSGGSSVRVNVCGKNGVPLNHLVLNQIESFGRSFKAGHFDGMYDIYEYRTDVVTTDNGTPMKHFPSYVFTENKPKWDSVEYWVNEIVNEGRDFISETKYMSKAVRPKVEKVLVQMAA